MRQKAQGLGLKVLWQGCLLTHCQLFWTALCPLIMANGGRQDHGHSPQDHWDKWNLRDKVGLQAEELCTQRECWFVCGSGVGVGGERG